MYSLFSFLFLFFSPSHLFLPYEIPKLSTNPPVSRLPTVWKLLLDVSFPRTGLVPDSFVSLFVFYILSISFQREWAAFLGVWCLLLVFRSCFVEVSQYSNDLLKNLVGGRKTLPVLFLHVYLNTAIFCFGILPPQKSLKFIIQIYLNSKCSLIVPHSLIVFF